MMGDTSVRHRRLTTSSVVLRYQQQHTLEASTLENNTKERAEVDTNQDDSLKRKRKQLPEHEETLEEYIKNHEVKIRSGEAAKLSKDGIRNLRKYIVLSDETSSEDIWNIMNQYWKVSEPRLIVSIAGGSDNFFLDKTLTDHFKRGLMKLATTKDVWFITNGLGQGVAKLVGDAMSDNKKTKSSKTVVLGIAPWDRFKRNTRVTEWQPEEKTRKPDKTMGDDRCFLDRNHSHFILADTADDEIVAEQKLHKTGAERELRKTIENYIRRKAYSKTQSGTQIPFVLLVFEGGTTTMTSAAESLKAGIPVVVVAGSGRTADVITNALKRKLQDHPERVKESESLRNMVKEILAADVDDTYLEDLKTVLQYHERLKIYNIDDHDRGEGLDRTVLSALLKVLQNFNQKLELALDWNRCDIAKQEIFTRQHRENWETTNRRAETLNKFYSKVVKEDQADFIQLFLDYGLDLQEFFTYSDLKELYTDYQNEKVMMGDTSVRHRRLATSSVVLRYQHQHTPEASTIENNTKERGEADTNQDDSLEKNIKLLPQDIRNYEKAVSPCCKYGKDKEHKAVKLCRIGEMINTLSGGKYKGLYACKKKVAIIGKVDHPERDMLFYALTSRKYDMAKLFWRRGSDHIGGALTASSILNSMHEIADDIDEILWSEETLANAIEFEHLAVAIIQECDKEDRDTAHKLLTRVLMTWGTVGNMNKTSKNTSGNPAETNTNSASNTNRNAEDPNTSLTGNTNRNPEDPDTSLAGNNDRHAEDPNTGLTGNTSRMPESINISLCGATNQNPKGTNPSLDGELRQKANNTNTDSKDEGKSTLLNIANDARQKLFLKQTCIQTLLHKVWKGDIKASDKMICLGIFFPFIALIDNLLMRDESRRERFTSFILAPVVKFAYHTMANIVFLAFFSLFLLTDLKHLDDGGPGIFEYIVYFWAVTMMVEEIPQMAEFYHLKDHYYSHRWNIYDTVHYVFFILCIVLRFTVPNSSFAWVQNFYAISLITFFLRFLRTFYVQKVMGPKLVMVIKMLVDFGFFVGILLVFMLGYGVAIMSLRYPNSPYSWTILRDVLYMPYWQMYAELFLEDIQAEDCTNPGCPQFSWLAVLLSAMYLLLVHILLLNLLIAMFSFTFDKVHNEAETYWRANRYLLVREYHEKSWLAPPGIIVWHLIKFTLWLCKKDHCLSTKAFRESLYKRFGLDISKIFVFEKKEESDEALTEVERAGMESVLFKMESSGKSIQRVVEENDDFSTVNEELGIIAKRIDALQDQQQMSSHNTKVPSGMEILSIRKDIHCLEDNMYLVRESLADILEKLNSQPSPGN